MALACIIVDTEEPIAERKEGLEALALELRPKRLTVGVSTVNVTWELDLRNVSGTQLVALRIWSDMTSAHGGMHARQQLAGPRREHASLHKVAGLFPGAKGRIKGEWSFPLTGVQPVESATAIMVLPLARFRFVGAGFAPFRAAFLIGLPPEPDSGRLKPVRLDQGTQTHTEVAAKLLG